jgi:hypothetical protein
MVCHGSQEPHEKVTHPESREQRTQDAVEQLCATAAVHQVRRPASTFDPTLDTQRMTPMKVEQDRHECQAVCFGDRDGRPEVLEGLRVEPLRHALLALAEACPPIAEEKPSDDAYLRRGEACEDVLDLRPHP